MVEVELCEHHVCDFSRLDAMLGEAAQERAATEGPDSDRANAGVDEDKTAGAPDQQATQLDRQSSVCIEKMTVRLRYRPKLARLRAHLTA